MNEIEWKIEKIEKRIEIGRGRKSVGGREGGGEREKKKYKSRRFG